MKIKSGVVPCAVRALIYGPEGIGKTTLASKFPNPVFIDIEGGTARMDVRRFTDEEGTWDGLLKCVDYVADHPEGIGTLVIDTLDKADQMCAEQLCKDENKDSIEDFGYGKGYVRVAEKFGDLLRKLDKVNAKGIHVVLVAHAKLQKFEQPDEAGAYDRWSLKLSKQTAPLPKEWCDMMLFCNYKTLVVRDSKTNVARPQGGKRVMYTTHHLCWDAKNRFGLEDELPLSYEAIRAVVEGSMKNSESGIRNAESKAAEAAAKAEEGAPAQMPPLPGETRAPELSPVKKRLRELMKEDGISEGEIKYMIGAKKLQPGNLPIDEYPDEFIKGALLDKWDAFVRAVKRARVPEDELPF